MKKLKMWSRLNAYPRTLLFSMGCLSALAMAPVYAWWLMALGYATLIHTLNQTTSYKDAGFYSFAFFLGHYLTSLYWISNSLFVDFDLWWWALPFSFIGLPLLLTLFPTSLLALAALAPQKFKAAAFILAIMVADIARGHLFTGFPWNFPAHTWANNEIIMQTLIFIGIYGLNSLTILFFCALPFLPRMTSGFLIVLAIASGFWISPAPIQTSIKDTILIQANIPQKEKWDPAFVARNFNRYIDMSRRAIDDETTPQTIIWPETAISRNLLTYPKFNQHFKDFLHSLPDGSLLITGYLDTNGRDFFNSLAVFNREDEIIQTYNKHHLVPFGEYMPFGLDTLTGFKGFQSGNAPTPITVGDLKILPLICYEIIFPRYSHAAGDSDYILNITNDSWFGHTAGPYQHLDHARFRAAENNISVIRVSGNGISAFIDDMGRAVKHTPLNHPAILSME